MKTPPLLLGATLVFWGGQTNLLLPSICMAAAVEGSRLLRGRWEFSDEDFGRVWSLCTLLVLATALWVFTDNGGTSSLSGLFRKADIASQLGVSAAGARTAVTMIRWLPMTLLPFVLAQAVSGRENVPVSTISLLMRRRIQKARERGETPELPTFNAAYPYWLVCLFAASTHPSASNDYFFCGAGIVGAWAMWPYRSRRLAPAWWGAVIALTLALGFLGERGIAKAGRLVESYDAELLAAFGRHRTDPSMSRTAIGSIGRLKLSNRIAIRLETPVGQNPPEYLREASYRTNSSGYRSTYWFSSESMDDFQPLYAESNGKSAVLVPGRTHLKTVKIACYLPDNVGLLPLPSGCARISNLPFDLFILKTNQLGDLYAAQGLGLAIFDAQYGPGPTFDSPPTAEDEQVSSSEEPALKQVIAEMKLATGMDDEAKMLRLRNFFQNNFTYSLWQPPRHHHTRETNETALARFLLKTRSGHCEYFATATVLLLRELGIPARYAVGYAVHESAGANKYVVRERDAHAWCLAWNEAHGEWEDFDTTPASWVAEEATRGAPFQWLQDGWSWLWFQFSKFYWGESNLRQYLFWSLIPVLAILIYQILARRAWRKHGKDRESGAEKIVWPGADSEFYELEGLLADRGYPRQPDEPITLWLERAGSGAHLESVRNSLNTLVRLHQRYRFDPLGLDEFERQALRREAADCVARLKQSAHEPVPAD